MNGHIPYGRIYEWEYGGGKIHIGEQIFRQLSEWVEFEKELICTLMKQGYEYLKIHLEAKLIENLGCKLEQLNEYE